MASKYSVILTASDKTKAAFDSAKKNSKDLDLSLKNLRNNVNDLGKGFAAAVAASAASLALLTKETITYAAEIDRLSALTNTSTDEFQRYAAGAKLVQIEQEKLADIFKDTSDKVGDFLQTGGGPLADFFENIAPQIGVTAEEFRNLSGPEALQLYVSSLEKANVSQNEMTFFMEAIASDATLLLPLLRNNGEGFKALGDAAQDAGAIMSGETLRSAQELNAIFLVMEQSGEGLKNQIREGTMPVIRDLAGEFITLSTDTALADGVVDLFNGTIKGLASTAVGAFAALQLFGKGLGGIAAAADSAFDGVTVKDFLFTPSLISKISDNSKKVKQVFEISIDDLEKTALGYGEVLNGIFDAGNGTGSSDERVKTIVNLLDEVRNAAGRPINGPQFNLGNSDEVDKALTSLERLKGQLEQQVATFGASETAVLKYRLTVGDLSDEVNQLGAAGEGLAQAILAESEALEKLQAAQEAEQEAQRRSNDLKQQAAQITESVLTPMEQYLKKLEEIDDLLDESALSEEIAVRAREKAHKDYEEAKNELDEMTEFVKEAARNMQDAMADGFFDIMQGEFGNLADTAKRTFDRIVANALAVKASNFLIGKDFEETGELGGFLGKVFGGLFGGGRALGGPVTAGVPYLVNENTPRSEIFVPNQSGTIMPAEKIGGSNVSVYITIKGNADAQTIKASASQAYQQLGNKIQRDMRRNN